MRCIARMRPVRLSERSTWPGKHDRSPGLALSRSNFQHCRVERIRAAAFLPHFAAGGVSSARCPASSIWATRQQAILYGCKMAGSENAQNGSQVAGYGCAVTVTTYSKAIARASGWRMPSTT